MSPKDKHNNVFGLSDLVNAQTQSAKNYFPIKYSNEKYNEQFNDFKNDHRYELPSPKLGN